LATSDLSDTCGVIRGEQDGVTIKGNMLHNIRQLLL